MIIYEDYGTNKLGVELTRAYSDADVYIERDEMQYTEAIDPTELNRHYTETDIPIGEENEEEATDEEYAEAGKIFLGVEQ